MIAFAISGDPKVWSIIHTLNVCWTTLNGPNVRLSCFSCHRRWSEIRNGDVRSKHIPSLERSEPAVWQDSDLPYTTGCLSSSGRKGCRRDLRAWLQRSALEKSPLHPPTTTQNVRNRKCVSEYRCYVIVSPRFFQKNAIIWYNLSRFTMSLRYLQKISEISGAFEGMKIICSTY